MKSTTSPTPHHPPIGIDLGTTHSLVATVHQGRPVVLENSLGRKLTPSAVSFEDDQVLVGEAARARAVRFPADTALSFKRDMGSDKNYLGARSLRPEELSACVLRTLKQDAEAALGHPVERAVVTVPAYFNELQRRATRDAARLAGLEVDRLLNEPTAAAIAFGLHQMDRELQAVVLDLGGGTFDVTVLEILEGVIEIQATAGDVRLGGDDFTEALADWAAERLTEEHGAAPLPGSSDEARLREAAERAKVTLSGRDEARLALPELRLGDASVDVELTIDRDTAEELWRPLLTRLEGPIRRALRDADVTPEDVDEVLLVGGSTRVPAVVATAARLFGRMPRRDLPADEVVALGAALQAGLAHRDETLEDLVVTDIAPFTLGVNMADQIRGRVISGLFAPILERGTVLPASRVQTFYTMADYQRHILVKVYQGEHSLCSDNEYLGELMVDKLPIGPAGREALDIRFTYDLNGLLEVETTVLSTGHKESLVLEGNPGRLSRDEIEAARRKMDRLKFHPREALPNKTALERGEAHYQELTGFERELMGRALAYLRAALDGRRQEEIDDARDHVLSLLP